MTNFNKEQLAVINAPTDEISVVAAAAGSGKTTTLVERINHIIKNNLVDGKIIAISFTKAASNDLKEKLKKTLTEDEMKSVITGTFHSVFGSFIRKFADEVGLSKNFTIIDETSTDKLIEQTIMSDENLKDEFESIVKQFELIGKTYRLKHLTQSVSYLINNVHPSSILKKSFSEAEILNQLQFDTNLLNKNHFNYVVKVFFESFKQAKLTSTLTYDQILVTTYLLAINNMFDTFKDTIGYIVIDEFQDTNYIQYETIKQLFNNNVMLIGDVNQSIYEFRGAKPEIMSKLAEEHTVYNMRYNYRSYQDILDLGNNVISNNIEGTHMFKPMIQGAPIDKSFLGAKQIQFNSAEDEAKIIELMIKRLIDSGVEQKDIAILVRNRLVPPILVKYLLSKGIKLNDTTKSADFIKSDTIRDIFSFLKILVNPKDIYAFIHTLDRPKKGVGPVAISKIQEKAEEFNLSIVEFVLSDKVTTLTPSLRNKLITYSEIYNDLQNNREHRSLVDVIDYILDRIGYIEWISKLKDKDRHLSNIEKLKDLANDYNSEFVLENYDFTVFDLVSQFLFEFSVVNKVENEDGVVISTIHNSKGLEWDFVFLVGMDEGILPTDNTSELESDRRLAYVAITRAKHGLYMCSSFKRPVFVKNNFDTLQPSSFVYESKVQQTRAKL